MGRRRVVWSPVEIRWLKRNKSKPITQLSIELAKSWTAVKKKLAELEGKSHEPASSLPEGKRTHIGKRSDLGIFLRSSWEANCMRVFLADKKIKLVEYEPYTFSFTPFGVVKGTVSYTPDFKLTYKSGRIAWVEVKGWLTRQDKTKLRRFKKYYPEEFEKLEVIVGSEKGKVYEFFRDLGVKKICAYRSLEARHREHIQNWE